MPVTADGVTGVCNAQFAAASLSVQSWILQELP